MNESSGNAEIEPFLKNKQTKKKPHYQQMGYSYQDMHGTQKLEYL